MISFEIPVKVSAILIAGFVLLMRRQISILKQSRIFYRMDLELHKHIDPCPAFRGNE